MNPVEREHLIEQIAHDQERFQRLARNAALRWTDLDLTMSQLKAVVTIADAGSLPIGQVGVALGIGKPAASLLVEALVQLGLAVRNEDAEDRRRTLVRLSAAGQELVDRLTQIAIGRLREWLAQLDDAELAAMARGLRALVTVASSSEHVTTPWQVPVDASPTRSTPTKGSTTS